MLTLSPDPRDSQARQRLRQRRARDERRLEWIEQSIQQLRHAQAAVERLDSEQAELVHQIERLIAELAEMRLRIRTGAISP